MKAVRSLLVFVVLLMAGGAKAQYTDRYWCFGDSAGIDFKNLSNPQPGNSILRSRGTCASICDSSGDLIFYCSNPNIYQWITNPNFNYTLGYVVNKDHQIMISGDSIVGTL